MENNKKIEKEKNIIIKNEPKEAPKEEKVQNKNSGDIKVENYRKINPQSKINRERYSSLTTNESRFSRNNDFHLKKRIIKKVMKITVKIMIVIKIVKIVVVVKIVKKVKIVVVRMKVKIMNQKMKKMKRKKKKNKKKKMRIIN